LINLTNSCTNISADATTLFASESTGSLPKVKNLSLNLSGWVEINDTGFKALVADIVKQQPNLQQFTAKLSA